MAKEYRVAIIGVGAIAGVHAKSIGELENAKLVAGSCRSEAKGRRFAEQFGVNWYPDYEEMLDREKPEMVTLCTPSGAHLEPACAAARRGIHVLCEKPIEITTSRADQMIEACRISGVLFGGIFPQRFNPLMRVVYDTVAAGRVGDLSVANSYVPWWRDDAYYAPERWQGKMALDGGGAMMNQSIHGVDAIQWIAGAAMPELGVTANPVAEVFAYTAKRGHDPQLIEVEDTAVAVLRYRNGALGQLLGTTSVYPGTLRRLQVGGRDGTIEVLEDQLLTFRFRHERAEDAEIRKSYAAATKSGGGASDPMAIGHEGHRRNIRDFIAAIDEKRSPMLDGNEARKAVEIIEALYRSAGTGQPVRIPER